MHSTDKIKHLILEAEGHPDGSLECLPRIYVEARIDFSDVRTGFRETVSLSKALEIYSDDAGLLWADDMIRDVDPQKLKPFVPDSARLEGLPGFVDANFISRVEAQFIQYLLRSYEAKIYRNYDLNAYSSPGESPQDFIERCGELLDGPMRRELDLLREVYNRKLEQIVQKYLNVNDSGRLEQARMDSQKNDIFFRYSERIAGLFLQSDPGPHPSAASSQFSPGRRELEERLSSVEFDAHRAILRLRDSYAEKARAVDEYILHPNLKDIHFVRSCILWMPARAA